jgi:Mg/Co/Ni transporter MgtE
MTTILVTASTEESAAEVADRLAEARDHDVDVDAVTVVDESGRLVADLPLLQLLLALRVDPDVQISSLIGDDEPTTVARDTPADEVAKQLIEARRLSVVVVEAGRPIGRILADDVLDQLVPSRGRFHFPRLLQ